LQTVFLGSVTRRTTVEEAGRVVAIVQLSQVDLRARSQLAHTTDQPGRPTHWIVRDREQPEEKNGIVLSALRAFVPSLSWQKDRRYVSMAFKIPFSHTQCW